LPGEDRRLSALEHDRAALLALGIVLGDERLARLAGLRPSPGLLEQATAIRQGTTLRGRDDWSRQYAVSAALAVMALSCYAFRKHTRPGFLR